MNPNRLNVLHPMAVQPDGMFKYASRGGGLWKPIWRFFTSVGILPEVFSLADYLAEQYRVRPGARVVLTDGTTYGWTGGGIPPIGLIDYK